MTATLYALGGLLVGVCALGWAFNAVHKPTRFLVLLLALSVPMLPLAGCATLKPNPSQTEIQKTHDAAIKMANGITLGLGIADTVLDVATVQHAAGQLTTTTLRDVAKDVKVFATAADKALDVIRTVADQPSLKNTVQTVVTALEPLIRHLDASSQDSLRSLGLALHVALNLLDAYLGGEI